MGQGKIQIKCVISPNILNHGTDGRRKRHPGLCRTLWYHFIHSDGSTSSEDLFFDQVVAQLQEILISPHFENDLTSFMRTHWHIFDQGATQASLQLAFSEYQGKMKAYLQNVCISPCRILLRECLSSPGPASGSFCRAGGI